MQRLKRSSFRVEGVLLRVEGAGNAKHWRLIPLHPKQRGGLRAGFDQRVGRKVDDRRSARGPQGAPHSLPGTLYIRVGASQYTGGSELVNIRVGASQYTSCCESGERSVV